MLDVTIDGTIKILRDTATKEMPAPIRVMLLSRLADSWKTSPVSLSIPESLIRLGRYADKSEMFAIQAGKLTSFLLTIKNGVDYGTNYN